jgi:hypothetical protein
MATRDRLIELTLNQLKVICDTATSAVAEVKSLNSIDCSSNIKVLITRSNSDRIRYRVVQRSGRSAKARYDDDERIAADPYYLDRNAFFASVCNERTEDYFVLPSQEKKISTVSDYIRTIAGSSGDEFSEPSLAADKFYNYCLTVPIVGRWSLLQHATLPIHFPRARLGERGAWTTLRENVVLGFLSIDSKSIRFNDGFDINVMGQLAREAFYVMRGYYSVLLQLAA